MQNVVEPVAVNTELYHLLQSIQCRLIQYHKNYC